MGCIAIVIAMFSLSSSFGLAAEKKPAELQAARKNYEEEFFRKLESIQVKYQRALEQYQREFTRNGKLDAAKEAQQEVELAKHWDTIPVKLGARAMTDPQLKTLLKYYENACFEVMPAITERYQQTLLHLKSGFAQAGNLEASLVIETELAKLAEGKGEPAEKGGIRYLTNLTKEEFGEWLEKQTFGFVGTIAGVTRLKFTKGKVEYGVGVIYDYKVTQARTVEIIKGGNAHGFVLEFSNDLQSGTLQSALGKYPLQINGKDPVSRD